MTVLLDLIETLPKLWLLVAAAAAVVVAPLVAVILGGTGAIIALLIGVVVVAGAGGLLALRVHLDRMPLVLAPTAVEGRLDGHRALHFRARLGRGRPMDRVSATVQFVPAQGDPIALDLLVDEQRQVLGPWTIVAVDRADALPDVPGHYHVALQATEAERSWSVARSYNTQAVVAGRFRSGIVRQAGKLAFDRAAWGSVEVAEPSGSPEA